ncbi:winged helix-turn-helix domain-containing protein [Streptomyces chartreusis]
MAAMSRATRRIIVAHLMRDGMSPVDIASELGVSRDTVRRDAEATHQGASTDAAPDAQADAPGLLVPETPQTARDLEVLCAAFKARPEDAARYAIHQAARHVRTWQQREQVEGRRTA